MSATAAPIRLAIVTPKENAWSETFIAAHIERLKGVELVLAGGELPTHVVNGKVLRGKGAFAYLRDQAAARALRTDQDGILVRRIAAVLRRARIDVVLAEYGTTAHAMLAPCALAGVPLVAHFHGFDAHVDAVIKAHHDYRALFAQSSALVVVSRGMEQQLLDLGALREKVVRNSCGVDAERFAMGDPARTPPHFLFVGRFVDKKAPHLALSAFERLVERVPEAKLTMVGQGPLWESCAQRVRSSPLAGRVELPGILSPDEVASLLRGARAFVLHSVRALNGDCEGTPVAVLEAMASGIPVVATRHAGIGDVVVHEEHGLLCDEHDVEAMAMNLERVARDPQLAGELGRAGRAKAEREHRVEDSIAGLQAILERVARGTGRLVERS
ncbi:MAG: glycosyltransferase family 4 protein [Flavobacteriales bacterium]|nr:glycosyltransferase family 4 protein [Flavobacteriales bacterium]